MTSRKSLKLDLKLLKDTFSKEHERFQVSQAATDQLTCRFIGENGKKYDIHANIPVRVRFLVDLVFVVCHFRSVFWHFGCEKCLRWKLTLAQHTKTKYEKQSIPFVVASIECIVSFIFFYFHGI